MKIAAIAVVVMSAALGVASSLAAQIEPSDRELINDFTAAMVVSPTPLSLQAAQDAWRREYAERTASGEAAADLIAERREALTDGSARDVRISELLVPGPDRIERGCVTQALQGCNAFMGGYLRARDHVLHWQLQDGHTDEDGIRAGVVFLSHAGAARIGPLRPVAWGFDAARFDAPVLFNRGETLYIAVPGIHAGSGMGNADLLFRWTPGGAREMTQIDTWSWRDQLASRLPAGMTGQSVRMDYHEMFASMPLARESDGGCCATGGSALLSFDVEGDRLVVTDVQIRP